MEGKSSLWEVMLIAGAGLLKRLMVYRTIGQDYSAAMTEFEE
jgi:hypothetical protein